MNSFANEDVMWERLKDIQMEAENARMRGPRLGPASLRLARLLAQRAWLVAGLAARRGAPPPPPPRRPQNPPQTARRFRPAARPAAGPPPPPGPPRAKGRPGQGRPGVQGGEAA